MKYCVYGNPTIDIIEYEDGLKVVSYGGGSYYSSLPIISRGIPVEVYSVYSPLLSGHPIAQYIVKRQYSTRTNLFYLRYRGGARELKIMEKSPEILNWNTHSGLCIVIANPVINEIGYSLLKTLRSKSVLLAIDIQGFVREQVDANIYLKPSKIIYSILELADIVHADISEFKSITSMEGVQSNYHEIREITNGVIVVTQRPGKFILLTKERVKFIEIPEDYIADYKTGAGDYYLASYTIHYNETRDPEISIYRAHRDTTIWLKNRVHRGPHYTPTTQPEDLLHRSI